ncbi:MAG: autotransporter outer membrane beta-barrel domain-containing protein [Bacteroidales bacterium]|nr:autotransporter outer membrane beta-barrel domain-containing protein [Bacteroidales bacterium]
MTNKAIATCRGILSRCAAVVLLLVGAATAAVAQNMTVKSFEALPNDLTATLADTKRTSRTDGRDAAVIKIQTREKDFNFDVGSISLVGDPVYKTGEIWIYLPSRTQKITISHPRFGQLRDYFFPLPIESGKTYLMVLDPGVGRYVTINTAVARSAVFINGDSVGISPLVNHYLLYGKHRLMARNDRMQGEIDFDVVNDGTGADLAVTIPMEDQSAHYGQVFVTTDPDAAIVYQGEIKGVGEWVAELHEGDYVIETRKINADPARTTFTVKPKQVNRVQALPPVPHRGYLSLYTRPMDAELRIDGKHIDHKETIELPVGNHVVGLSRKDYYDLEKEYRITNRQTVMDTLNMERIQYLHKNQFYFGGAYTFGSFSGATALLGFTYANIDVQVSYTFGISKSDVANYYDLSNNTQWTGRAEYKLNVIGAKLGYQIPLVTHFGIVPQVGFAAHLLSSSVLDGTVPDQDAKAACATVGAKFIYSPMQHFCLFAAPEYDIAVSKGKQYQALSDAIGFSAGGFFCHVGIILNF